MQRQYTTLKAIAVIFKVLGIIVAIVTIFGALLACLGGAAISNAGRLNGFPNATTGGGVIFLAIIALIYGGIVALFLYAAGEGIYLMLALEANTRQTATLLQESVRAGNPMLPQP